MYLYQNYLSFGIDLKEKKGKKAEGTVYGKAKKFETSTSMMSDILPLTSSFNPKCETCSCVNCIEHFNPSFHRKTK